MEDALAMREHPQIAIDGAAGTGKSTIGERVARHLGCLYVDTGAFYRALTYLALAGSIDPDDGAALATLARSSSITIAAPTVLDGRQYTVLDNGQDITRELRTPAVETNISRVSHHQEVRQALRERQREMADEQAVVMVGRDIGTVVLPNADLKIVLSTSLEERARRRHADMVALYGENAPAEDEVREDMARRDAGDATQMLRAPDAIVINNDHLLPEETVARILTILAEMREQARGQQHAGGENTGEVRP
jgi:CMP/dCMP kinase